MTTSNQDNNIYSLDYRGETLAVIRGMEQAIENAIAYEKHGFEPQNLKIEESITINLFEEAEE